MVNRIYRCITIALAVGLIQCGETTDNPQAIKDFGIKDYDPISTGAFIYEFHYVPGPYVFQRRGLAVYLNDICLFKGDRWPQPVARQGPTPHPGDPTPGASPFDSKNKDPKQYWHQLKRHLIEQGDDMAARRRFVEMMQRAGSAVEYCLHPKLPEIYMDRLSPAQVDSLTASGRKPPLLHPYDPDDPDWGGDLWNFWAEDMTANDRRFTPKTAEQVLARTNSIMADIGDRLKDDQLVNERTTGLAGLSKRIWPRFLTIAAADISDEEKTERLKELDRVIFSPEIIQNYGLKVQANQQDLTQLPPVVTPKADSVERPPLPGPPKDPLAFLPAPKERPFAKQTDQPTVDAYRYWPWLAACIAGLIGIVFFIAIRRRNDRNPKA